MAKFFTVASSSSGNCYYLGSGNTGVLIDCGISCRSILSALMEKGVDPGSLSGMLITHEHIDHIRGLENFLKKYHLPVYASEKVLDFLAERDYVPPGTDLRPADENGFLAAGMMVTPFRTSHDSVGSLGFSIATAEERKITICTDTGYLTEGALEHLPKSDLVLMESNYDLMMLLNGRYPYPLKRRIEGPQGHLSNTDCASALPDLVRSGTTRIVLAHLSKENNYPDLALQTSVSELSMAGIMQEKDYTIFAAPRSCASETVLL
ncbi:MAG TPA: MBL fold metallo-hydrolase [Oscillospiraceae bacterium]|nr:MBL fold metallo-hydrolase [Oscillospiraceae bacterium]HRW56502.1 MBL fold metallo-hydrolase [Oscillospiraceae bacterium]